MLAINLNLQRFHDEKSDHWRSHVYDRRCISLYIMGGAMAFQFEHINLSPFSMTMQILAQYGLTAFLYAVAALAAAGIVVAVLGLKET